MLSVLTRVLTQRLILKSIQPYCLYLSFEANIYKAGINPCVDVPLLITKKMVPVKGFIPIKGKIEDHPFQQTLVTVKNSEYRLYVNGPMLKGSNTKSGNTVKFIIEQDFEPKSIPMPKEFKRKLEANNLTATFKKLTAGRQKEILKYLNFLKTKEALIRNIDKVILSFKKKNQSLLFSHTISLVLLSTFLTK